MEVLEIFLASAGILIIIVSFVISSKNEKHGIQEIEVDTKAIDRMLEEKESRLKEQIETMFADRSEQVMEKTDDRLSSLSNQKVMELSEYSDQVIEKIENNHKEVVFLYNMLNEKEKDMKTLIVQLEKTRTATQEMMLEENSRLAEPSEPPDAVGKEAGSPTVASGISRAAAAKKTKKTESPPSEARTGQQASKIRQETAGEREVKLVDGSGQNNNEKILELYREGKSVVEIARYLGQGQGEVKLVIDLFLGAGQKRR